MKVLTYLINLDGSQQRLDSATQQLSQHGFKFTRISAYDGRGKASLDFPQYDDQKARKTMGRSLLGAELGCYLSHVQCVEKFLQTDADYLIVFEDDLKLIDNSKCMIKEILGYLEQHQEIDWYLINIAAKKRKLSKPLMNINEYRLNRAYYFPILTLGLIWNRKGAEEFLKQCFPIKMPIDNMFQSWLSQNAKGLSVYLPLVMISGAESEIDSELKAKNQKRNSKENRHPLYIYYKQKRMLRDKWNAMINIVSH